VSDSVETSFEARALEGADIQLLVSLTRPPPLGFAPLFLLVFAINLAVVVLAARWLAELADRDAAAEGRGGVGIGMGPYRVFRPGISRIRATDRQSERRDVARACRHRRQHLRPRKSRVRRGRMLLWSVCESERPVTRQLRKQGERHPGGGQIRRIRRICENVLHVAGAVCLHDHRAIRRARKIRTLLGTGFSFSDEPRGMHWLAGCCAGVGNSEDASLLRWRDAARRQVHRALPRCIATSTLRAEST
jgi:hypothetical protein